MFSGLAHSCINEPPDQIQPMEIGEVGGLCSDFFGVRIPFLWGKRCHVSSTLHIYIGYAASSPNFPSKNGRSSRPKFPSYLTSGLAYLHGWRSSQGGFFDQKWRPLKVGKCGPIGTELRPTSVFTCRWVWCRDRISEGRCVFVKFLQIPRDFQFLKELKSTYLFGSFLHPLMCLKRNYRQNSPFSKKKLAPRRLIPLRSKELCKMVMGKCLMRSVKNNKKKVFQLVTGRARKPDPRRCFFKNFVVTYQPPPLLGHRVSDRFGGENERMWVKGHSIKSHGFLKVYHLEHLEPTFLIYFRVLWGYASVVLRGSQRNWGERIPLPNFWKNIQVEPALSSTGRNHLNFTVVDPCCARSHSCTLGCTRCVRMMGFLPSRNLTKMMILQQCWWGFRMIWFFWVHMCFTCSHC